jgi:hypothetical protein
VVGEYRSVVVGAYWSVEVGAYWSVVVGAYWSVVVGAYLHHSEHYVSVLVCLKGVDALSVVPEQLSSSRAVFR